MLTKIILKKGATIYLKRFLSGAGKDKIQTDNEIIFDEKDVTFNNFLQRRVYWYSTDPLPVHNGNRIIFIEWEPTHENEMII